MTGRARVLAGVVALLALTPAPLTAASDVALVGAQVPALVRGQRAEIAVTLKAASRATKPVRLQVKIGGTVAGELAEGPLGANQTRTYRIGVTVPAGAASPAVLSVLVAGEEVGRQSVSLGAPAPAARATVPSLTQTVATATITLAGNRGASRSATRSARPPVPSLTQTVAAPAITLVGNRGAAQGPAPPVPSLTQTVATPPITLVGNR